jgi:hypothetical protein
MVNSTGGRGATRGRQITGGEQASCRVGEGVVQPLPGAAGVWPVGIGRLGCGQRVEHGLPLRQRGRGEPRAQEAGSVAVAGEGGVAAPLVPGVVGHGAVGVDPFE